MERRSGEEYRKMGGGEVECRRGGGEEQKRIGGGEGRGEEKRRGLRRGGWVEERKRE